MASSPDPAPDPGSPPQGRLAEARAFVATGVAGRLIAAGAVIKLLALGLSAIGLAITGALQIISSLGGLALATGLGIILFKLIQIGRRRLLWRVRRKLIVSYLLIGLVPALLIVVFFILCGWLLFANLSSYLVRSSLAELGVSAANVAAAVAMDVDRVTGRVPIETLLAERIAANKKSLPGMSVAVIPADDEACRGSADSRSSMKGGVGVSAAKAGPWEHLEPPDAMPAWVSCDGFVGVLAFEVGSAADGAIREAHLFLRATARPQQAAGFAIVVDVPVSDTIKQRIEEATGIEIGSASLVDPSDTALKGRRAATVGKAAANAAPPAEAGPIPSVALLDVFDWPSGKAQALPMQIGMDIRGIYHRLSVTQASIGKRTFGDLLIYGLMTVSIMFLVIEVGAAATGMALARSITGSVHELFAGTERVRRGDFGHRIAVLAKDQLGELADSFNLMTGSIEDLLRQSAEKKRLEEEMRLARESQMSLLPRGPLEIPGMRLAAVCVPAREVGGDYYDVLPLPDGRVGMLIADVSGKGMSAALYMAELKGLMLSLSQIHQSPRDLLIEANKLISEHLDSRSFITMTYAVIDPAARTMRYARAGHTPLLYLANRGDVKPTAEILVPDGMVLGLRLDDGERFTRLLEEATLTLSHGDRLAFFTDGISEAMDDQAECFGEPRLAQMLEEHAHLPVEELRERILREIDAFVAGAPQHDDMTLILLEVDGESESVPAHA